MIDKAVISAQIVHRLKQVLGLAQDKEVAVYFGLSPTSVYNWQKRGTIPVDECVSLALEKGISLDWLVLGRGEPPEGVVEEEIGESVQLQSPYAEGDFVSVPRYDIQAAAGDGSLFEQERIEGYLKFRKDWISAEGLHLKDLVALTVSGDSMYGTVNPSDTILVNRARKKPDGVFLVRVGDSLRVKRIQEMSDGSLRLSSDNDMYAPEVLPLEHLNQVEIIGHCHWRGGRVY